MKIVLYSPYFPHHFGGGEKYFLDAALVWAQAGHQVSIALGSQVDNVDKIKKSYQQFLGCSLAAINFCPSPLRSGSFAAKLYWSRQFDVLYYLTDGSAFFSLAKRNLMHIQTPLLLPPKTGWDKFKFNHFNIINTNSLFTKQVVEKSWGIKVDLVCYPGVSLQPVTKVVAKKPLILHVGRFFRQQHAKRQDVLLTCWRQLLALYPQFASKWQLLFIGSVEDEQYYQQCRQQAAGLPVSFLTNASRSQLELAYRQAAIYWHATGFGIDPTTHPEKMEHFGITTVEAMMAGAVPVVIAAAGQKEILGQYLSQYSWQTPAECVAITAKLMQQRSLCLKLGQQALKRSGKFAATVFAKQHLAMLKD